MCNGFKVDSNDLNDSLLLNTQKLFFHSPAAIVDMMGTYIELVLRAMLANCVPLVELGKVYSMWTFLSSLAKASFSRVYQIVFSVRSESLNNVIMCSIHTISTYVHVILPGNGLHF